ncbi:helix-turn-helix domain-containing protein [Halorussus salinisoli]|uniref:helix-turn-helix domain-containing protein n=1 Tax=Halorussus salinisoli TaxID=2558242 RepID=UPI0010C20F46|nr:helix-turn-helix domain-containing protein [Halorussus salinisoli]
MRGESVFAEVKIRDPAVCQVATASEPTATVNRVSRTVPANDEEDVTEELELADASSDADPTANPVDEANGVFRLRRPVGQGCACELIERHDCPVRSIYAEGGQLSLTFYARDLRTIRRAVADLKDVSDGVHLQCLYQTGEKSSRNIVYIDRELFTERQREVLRTAYEMGYFAHPKEANAGDVAASLGIARTTFAEHLSTAQRKLLDRLLGE